MQEKEDWANKLLQFNVPANADGVYSIFAGDDFDDYDRRASHLGFALVWEKDGKPDFKSAFKYQDGFEGGGQPVDLSGAEHTHLHKKQMEDSVPFDAQDKKWRYLVKVERQEKGTVIVRARKFVESKK
jgi:hypothetical protein